MFVTLAPSVIKSLATEIAPLLPPGFYDINSSQVLPDSWLSEEEWIHFCLCLLLWHQVLSEVLLLTDNLK